MSIRKPSAIEPALDAPEQLKASNRSFGIVFALAFLAIGLWPVLDARGPRVWSLVAACAFALTAAFIPWILRPMNVVWMRFGELLHRIVTPVVMGFVFFLVVVPIGLIMRVLGKDPIRLRHEPEARTYWIERQPPGPDPKTMTRQF